MNKQKHWFFITLLGIGSSVYLFQQIGITLPSFINNYLNDLLAIPIVLYIALLAVRLWKGYYIIFPLWLVLGISGYYSFYFEYYLPTYHPRYTRDVLDVLCYIGGGLLFYAVQKKS